MMKYSLVIQFPEEQYGDLDWIHKIENDLITSLINEDVDGHDVGSGTVNFFIYTNEPLRVLDDVKNILTEENVLIDAKIAYREVDSEDYTCLWPEGLATFDLM